MAADAGIAMYWAWLSSRDAQVATCAPNLHVAQIGRAFDDDSGEVAAGHACQSGALHFSPTVLYVAGIDGGGAYLRQDFVACEGGKPGIFNLEIAEFAEVGKAQGFHGFANCADS